MYSYAYCDFVGREVTLASGYDASSDSIATACQDMGYNGVAGGTSVCSSLFQPHAIGFSYWQATVPVDQKVCFTCECFLVLVLACFFLVLRFFLVLDVPRNISSQNSLTFNTLMLLSRHPAHAPRLCDA